MNPIGYEFLMVGMRFSLLCLFLSLLTAWRSRANYETWIKEQQSWYLNVAQHQYSASKTGFVLGRVALFVSFILFVFLMA